MNSKHSGGSRFEFPGRLLAWGALAAGLMINSGCFLVAVGAAGAGAGAVAYAEGRLTATIGKDFEQVSKAADAAVDQLGFARVSETKDALSQTTTSRTGADVKVTVTVSRVGDHVSKLEIRVGTFGDRAASDMILQKVQANL